MDVTYVTLAPMFEQMRTAFFPEPGELRRGGNSGVAVD